MEADITSLMKLMKDEFADIAADLTVMKADIAANLTVMKADIAADLTVMKADIAVDLTVMNVGRSGLFPAAAPPRTIIPLAASTVRSLFGQTRNSAADSTSQQTHGSIRTENEPSTQPTG